MSFPFLTRNAQPRTRVVVVVACQRACMLSAQSPAHLYTDLCTCNRPMIMIVIDDHGSSARKDLSSHVSAHGCGALLLRLRNQRVSGSDLLRFGTRECRAAVLSSSCGVGDERRGDSRCVTLMWQENVLHDMTCHSSSRIENEWAKERMKVPTCRTRERDREIPLCGLARIKMYAQTIVQVLQ